MALVLPHEQWDAASNEDCHAIVVKPLRGRIRLLPDLGSEQSCEESEVV
jgi:hypothetical protein